MFYKNRHIGFIIFLNKYLQDQLWPRSVTLKRYKHICPVLFQLVDCGESEMAGCYESYLDGTIMRNKLVFHVLIPKASLSQVFE